MALQIADPEQMLTTAQVARLFGVDPKTVARWALGNKVHAIRTPGGHRRFPAAQFVSLLNTPSDPQDAQ